ncbi:hypothetical protein HY637_01995 [Candidatus Woesearchaeota archaeon]|nr:hypothetical protein [Candidatus Woesearchaeota archaeon]
MTNVFGRSFQLAKESFRILLLDKELLLLPIISGIFILMILFTFIFPLFFAGSLLSQASFTITFYLWLFLFYIASYFISIFFNVALVTCVSIRLNGQDPVLMDGIKSSFKNIYKIFLWALVAATVGFILNQLERKSEGWVSRLVVSLVGVAWTLATFFVIPVMIFENKGTFASIKRSSEIFKKTWGESVVGQFGMGLFFFVIMLASLAISFLLGFMLMPVLKMSLVISLLIIFVPFIILIMLLSSVLHDIYLTALYTYATTRKVPKGFSEEFIKNAYAHKA